MSDIVGDDKDSEGLIEMLSPGEIQGRMEALHALIVNLKKAIDTSASPLVNPPFRAGYQGFYDRWFVFYGGAVDWSGRIFGSDFWPRFKDFMAAYERWRTMYNDRKAAGEQVPAAIPPPMRDLMDDAQKALAPLSGPIAGFGMGVLAIVFVAALVAWKR